MYYYDAVASICDETRRTDSYLICGGFNTVEEAVDYIDTHDISEVDYYKYCKDDELDDVDKADVWNNPKRVLDKIIAA